MEKIVLINVTVKFMKLILFRKVIRLEEEEKEKEERWEGEENEFYFTFIGKIKFQQ